MLGDGVVQPAAGPSDRDHKDEIEEQLQRRRRAVRLVRRSPSHSGDAGWSHGSEIIARGGDWRNCGRCWRNGCFGCMRIRRIAPVQTDLPRLSRITGSCFVTKKQPKLRSQDEPPPAQEQSAVPACIRSIRSNRRLGSRLSSAIPFSRTQSRSPAVPHPPCRRSPWP